eukprot:TRINITY_DN2338_c0_g1_i1.p1 TRINITY_DN2338_c0_g1~~TRINITY_DN2338_c0_g1_i1.p1  ORF type:complete len:198 (+),score=63.18 TRINITY_DN2338_c0_g1_i1:29-595(+)
MTDTDIAAELNAIPIDELVAAPLLAANRANRELARHSIEFIEDFCTDGKPDMFTIQVPSVTNGITSSVAIQAPKICLVNPPSLTVREVSVDFTMEIKSSVADTSKTDVNVAASGTVGVAKLSGSVSSSKTSTRKTDSSAKYNVHVIARDDGPAEGFSRLMNILQQRISSVPVGTGVYNNPMVNNPTMM